MKNAIKGALDKIGLRVIRTRQYFALDPLDDVARLFPERNISTVVDIGANVGNFARRVSSRLPSARILAFEPVGSTFRQLQENLREYAQVSSYQMAVGDAEGEATLHVQQNSEWNSLTSAVNRPGSDARPELVRIRRLDTMAEEGLFPSIDLLKTDTEGYDVNVLRGATRLLSSGQVGFILSEVGFDSRDARHSNFFELNRFLSDYNFTPIGFYDQVFSSYTDYMMYCNVLYCLRR